MCYWRISVLMFERPKIGIVGLGFVGGAVRDSFDGVELILVDPPKGLPHTFKDLQDCEAIFVCAPSPSNDDGSCNTSILEEILEKVNAIYNFYDLGNDDSDEETKDTDNTKNNNTLYVNNNHIYFNDDITSESIFTLKKELQALKQLTAIAA